MPRTHHALIQVAAQAELLHNDDTPMALEQNADRVTKARSDWFPWNY